LKTDLLSYFARAVWGASCRARSFIFRFNNLDFGPLAFFLLKNDNILKVSLKTQLDLQAESPGGTNSYNFHYSRLGGGFTGDPQPIELRQLRPCSATVDRLLL
jgi:hypothetical protein